MTSRCFDVLAIGQCHRDVITRAPRRTPFAAQHGPGEGQAMMLIDEGAAEALLCRHGPRPIESSGGSCANTWPASPRSAARAAYILARCATTSSARCSAMTLRPRLPFEHPQAPPCPRRPRRRLNRGDSRRAKRTMNTYPRPACTGLGPADNSLRHVWWAAAQGGPTSKSPYLVGTRRKAQGTAVCSSLRLRPCGRIPWVLDHAFRFLRGASLPPRNSPTSIRNNVDILVSGRA